MRRIIILGGTGSGKSVLARLLGKRLCLPVVHFDAIFYGPRWSPSDEQTFQAGVAEAIANDRWITDGNFVARASRRVVSPHAGSGSEPHVLGEQL